MILFHPNLQKCGNSSGVEHNLAKVGVASSNLVSRSIFLLLIFFIPLFSDTLVDRLHKTIKDEYPSINISSINIDKPNDLPNNFNEFILKEIILLNLRDDSGAFRAIYITPNKSNKSIFFNFKIDFKLQVLIAKRDIDRDHILNLGDYEQKFVNLKDYDKQALTSIPKYQLITKSKIKRGKILTNRHFKTLSDIRKGDKITAMINDGALKVEIIVTALSDGNIGQIISVRNQNNQILKAQVINKNQAIIK
ncbi:flagellar basal body P-ring biosynthesis protein [Campylobacter porcelli]|uniref:Flagella basal body P-ring formation protein FlgA n=1 Tax=Campylobacter porcelli TaxID=1660073 RepID=A0A1X9SWC7_9BACT|nr:flagellar basal body P-ring biosynthesis protein [Campylobacter sp. RM6137]